MNISQRAVRLRQFMQLEGINQAHFLKKVKIKNASLLQALKGGDFGWEIAAAINEAYPNCNIDWLMHGTGKMSEASSGSVELHERLKEIRVSLNLQKVEMAKILEVSKATYSKIEGGYQKVSLEHVMAINRHSKLPYAYIIGQENSKEFASKECRERLERLEEENASLKQTLEIFRETTKEKLRED